MTNKLIEKINSVYLQIETSEKELQKSLSNAEALDKVNQLNLGVRGLKAQELNIELFKLIEIFLDIADGSLEELPESVKNYYNLFKELQTPSKEQDEDGVKQLKEMINSFKKDNGKKE